MAYQEVKIEFTNGFEGDLIAPQMIAKIGGGEGRLAPYDMLLGALGSCLYATFLDIMRKKRIGFEKFEMVISGEKRSEVPTTLKWVKVEAKIYAPQKENGVERSFKLATEYCSVYQTISQVAEMSYELKIV